MKMDRLDFLITNGYMSLGPIIEPELTQEIISKVQASRRFSQDIFLTEAEYIANPQHKGVNPKPGHNYTEKCTLELAKVEANTILRDYLSNLLGSNYTIMDKKFVVGMPESSIPPWTLKAIKGNRVNNLGAFIRPSYRDITYFSGIDLHQDIIDWKDLEANFITLYIYLEDVGENDAPLYILPGTHQYGATVFPHDLEILDRKKGLIQYNATKEKSLTREYVKLLGPAGSVNLWHACLLHGTQPTKEDQFRMSLRYLIKKDPKSESCGLEKVNQSVNGPLSLTRLRADLDDTGVAVIKGNDINNV